LGSGSGAVGAAERVVAAGLHRAFIDDSGAAVGAGEVVFVAQRVPVRARAALFHRFSAVGAAVDQGAMHDPRSEFDDVDVAMSTFIQGNSHAGRRRKFKAG
jgi:hypothetical protein